MFGCGRGMIKMLTISPMRSASRWPASVATFTAATSPRTITEVKPPPTFS